MTSADGAGAMAAAPGPRAGAGAGAGAGAEGQRRLLRAVTRLQACARGFLLRRRLRSVRAEFEAVVLEIEGDLRQLRWSGRVLQSPRFGPEPSAGNPLDPGEAAENRTIPRRTREEPGPRGAERGGSCGNIPSSAPLPWGTAPNPQNPKNPQNPPDLGRGAAGNRTIPRRTREEPGPRGAERAGNSPSSAPDPKNPQTRPDLGRGAAQSPEEEEDEDEEGALAWASDSPEVPEELRGLPRRELQSHREHLLLELLWLQQAIRSRKRFLLLKQKLGVPSSTPRSCPAGEKPWSCSSPEGTGAAQGWLHSRRTEENPLVGICEQD